ncbi:MAG: Ig-like domain repeat protein [Acidobacteriaceae bacterium]|nr:Ig-like domain repeat protein [Acidobacteriaceae bacterium]
MFAHELPCSNLQARRRGLWALVVLAFAVVFLITPLAYAQSASTITLTASTAAPPENTPILLTAQVSGGSPITGFVSFYNGSMLLGRVPVDSSGVATLSRAFAPGWPSVVNAQYSGNAVLTSSVTTIPTVISTIGTTTHVLSVAGGPGAYQLTDTVTADGLTNPTGPVTYTDTVSNAVLGSQPLSPGNTVSSTTMNSGGGVGWWSGVTPPSMVIADLDGDGYQDMVISYGTQNSAGANFGAYGSCTETGGGFTVLYGNGPNGNGNPGNLSLHGGTNQSVCQPGITNMVAGDFDGDGVLDLLVATATDVTLYHGNGDGTFGDKTIHATGTTIPIQCGTALVAGNITNETDSYLGFVCADNATGLVTAFTNDGAGNFTQSWQTTVAGVVGMAIGTYTSTVVSPQGGALNLAVSSSSGTTSAIYGGNGDGTFTMGGTFDWTGPLVFVDIDGDGNTDILGTYGSGHVFSPYRGNGIGGYSGSGQTAWTGNTTRIGVGDFTGTGVPSWVVLAGNQAYLWQNKSVLGNNTFLWSQIQIGGYNSWAIDTGAPLLFSDFNNDGLDEFYSPAASSLNRFTPVNKSVSTAAFMTPCPAGPGTTDPVVASYPGNAFYSTATPDPSNAMYLVTCQIDTTVTLTPDFSTIMVGSTVKLKAIVTGQAGLVPTGSVTFEEVDPVSGTVISPLGNVGLDAAGVATLPVNDLAGGNHAIKATYYSGSDPNYKSGAYGNTGVSVLATTPLLTLTSDAATNPVDPNTTVTFTATIPCVNGVCPVATTPVTFYNNGVPLATVAVDAANCTATACTVSTAQSLAAGQYSISATYPGDPNFTPGATNTIGIQAGTPSQGVASITLTPLAQSVAPSAAVSMIATLHGSGTTPPGGTVDFYIVNADGSLTAIPGCAAKPVTTTSGITTAPCSTTAVAPLGVETYTISAVSSGDANYASTTSNPVSLVVAEAAQPVVTIALTPLVQSVAAGADLSFTATLSGSGATPGGKVSFYADGSATAIAGCASVAVATNGGVSTAPCTVAANAPLGVGSHTITAVSDGDDPNYAAATSNPVAAIVGAITQGTVSITLTPTTQTVAPNGAVEVIATLYGSTSTVPGGEVNFYLDNGILLNSTPVQVQTAGGVSTATFDTNAIAPLLDIGAHTLTAVSLNDPNYAPAASNPVQVIVATVTPPVAGDFDVNVTSAATQTVHPGAAATYQIAVGYVTSAFNNPVTLQITTAPGQTGLPAGAVPVFTPQSVTPGGGVMPATLTILTAQTTASNRSSHAPGYAALALLLLPLFGVRRFRRSLPKTALVAVLALLSLCAVTGVTGCGEGKGYFGVTPQTYTFTVTGISGNISHSAPQTVTLNLQ